MITQVGAPLAPPTSCLKVRHMFDVQHQVLHQLQSSEINFLLSAARLGQWCEGGDFAKVIFLYSINWNISPTLKFQMCTGEDSTHCSWYPKRGICSSRAKNREVLILVTPRRALSISRPWALRKPGKCLGKGRIEKKRVPIWWLCICSLSMNNKYSTLYSIGVCMDSGTGVSLSQPSTSGWKGLNNLHYKHF